MTDRPVTLKRSLSLLLITYYGLGNILGAGIYVLVGKVAGYAGMLVPLSFLGASLLAALTALSYAELSSRYPLSAGEAVYLHGAFAIPSLSMLVGILIIFAGIVSAATIVRGFVGYFQVLVDVPGFLVMVVLVTGLGGLAAWGIVESVRAAAIITLLEIVGLLLIIGVASPSLSELPARRREWALPMDPAIWQGIFVGAFLAFYAFIGFEDMVNVAEEVRDPVRNMPRAILLVLGVSTILYFAVGFACVLVVPPGELARSDAPLALVYQRATGGDPVLISVISSLAVTNGALIQIIMCSRVCYGLSRQGWLPEVLGRIHTVTRTPLIATALISAAILIMALWLPIETLAKATSFLILVVFALINLALWRIKQREPRPVGVFLVSSWVPIAGFAASALFVLYQFVTELR